jgi:CHAT domain-containing protein
MEMELNADLVVLSACETARGRVGLGEGIIGISWALFVAGSPATVVSQWKVESRSTTRLMVNLHQRLRAGTPPAMALRRAALKLLRSDSYRHPFYWAPFVVTGDGF